MHQGNIKHFSLKANDGRAESSNYFHSRFMYLLYQQRKRFLGAFFLTASPFNKNSLDDLLFFREEVNNTETF